MSNKIRVSAPGKVILHGEYAVVFFKKAVAVSVGLFTSLEVEPLTSEEVIFNFPAISLHYSLRFEDIRQLQKQLGSEYRYSALESQKLIPLNPESVKIIQEFVRTLSLVPPNEAAAGAQIKAAEAFIGLYLAIFEEPRGLRFDIETELPVGAGLGSSASFATSLVAGMLLSRNLISRDLTGPDLEKVNQWSFFSEKFVHGSPSGIDNYVTTYGGAVVFQRSQEGKEATTESFPKLEVRALLVDTTVPRSTSAMIAKMNKMKTESFETWQQCIDDIGKLVDSAMPGISQNRVCSDSIRENHKLLQRLGVSHPALDKIADLAEKNGLAGKLTGAGGGGCAFVFIPIGVSEDLVNNLKASLQESGFVYWDTKLGSRGLRVM